MERQLHLCKRLLAFAVSGLIALVGFVSGDIAFGVIGLAVISVLAGRLAASVSGDTPMPESDPGAPAP
jgi:hypothetical protein